MPSSKFSKPPVNEAIQGPPPKGGWAKAARPVLVTRAVPPKKAAVVVEPDPFIAGIMARPVTRLEQAYRDSQNNPPSTEESPCNTPLTETSSTPAAIQPRPTRKYHMPDTQIPEKFFYTTDAALAATANIPLTELTLDTKARKGMTSAVFVDTKRGSVRVAKSRFSTAAVATPRALMTEDEKKAARAAGREAVKNLTIAEKLRRIDEAAAKRREKALAEEQKKAQLVSA